MSSSEKYTNSQLNKWVKSDKPTLNDFNNDNNLLETRAMWKTVYDPDSAVEKNGGLVKYVDVIMDKVHPVNSIFLSMSATNPKTHLGVGTWSLIAQGRMLVGVNTGDTDFATPGKTGGSKHMYKHTHTGPSHTHSRPAHTHGVGTLKTNSTGAHTHMATKGQFYQFVGSGGAYHIQGAGNNNAVISSATTSSGAHSHSVSGKTAEAGTGATGASGTGATGPAGTGTQASTQTNMPPYFACYIWQRTA